MRWDDGPQGGLFLAEIEARKQADCWRGLTREAMGSASVYVVPQGFARGPDVDADDAFFAV